MKILNIFKTKYLASFLFLTLMAAEKIASAETKATISIPDQGVVSTPSEFVQGIYNWSLGLAAVSAFVMIVYNGILWMASGAVDKKSQAKQGIIDAILGLVLLLSAYLIFNTIDPNLLRYGIEEMQIQTIIPTRGSISTQVRPVQFINTTKKECQEILNDFQNEELLVSKNNVDNAWQPMSSDVVIKDQTGIVITSTCTFVACGNQLKAIVDPDPKRTQKKCVPRN